MELPRFGVRHGITALLFLLLSIAYGMRVNLSVAIVAMTDNTTSSNPDVPTYNWTDKSVVLSSFFWGYIVLQVFAGALGRTYGTKWILVGAMFVTSTGCMLIPLLADSFGSKGVMACRVFQGLSQGFFFPSIQNLLGQWAPVTERSTIATVVFSGASFGTIVTYPITGYISASSIGWPFSFYFFGICGYAWLVAWSIFGANSPSHHAKISKEEQVYIEKSLGISEDYQTAPIPWKAILTSMPVWAFVMGYSGQNWGAVTLLTEIPIYLNKIMKFDMQSNSLLSAAPYLAQFLFSILFGQISDHIINHKYVTRGTARKICNSLGSFVPAVALTILGFLPDNTTALSVAMIIIAVGVNGGLSCGFQVNPIDLSPKFAGTLMGIGSFTNVFSLIAPLLVQAVVTDETDKSLWRTIFLVASCVYVATNIFFVIFAAGETQWWDEEEPKKTKLTSIDSNVFVLSKSGEIKVDILT